MTEGAVVPLEQKPDEIVVKHLRELLERAEAGEVRSLAYVAEVVGPDVLHGYVVTGDVDRLICGLERLKLTLLRDDDDD